MKKQTMYNRLQKQYAKLNLRIQKAMQTGRFYAYTQFKQQQLLSRLKRCSFQLKQLGAGVAVVAALGMATPAVGQSYNLVERTGVDNHFDGIGIHPNTFHTAFVDIDGDGDQDLFTTYMSNLTMRTQYFENMNTGGNPDFVLQTNNPLGSFSGNYNLSFVDIDGDGDYDAFSTNYGYVAFYGGPDTTAFNYYENTAPTLTSPPTFVRRTGTDNPLDSVVTHLKALNAGFEISGFPSFVDIDGDGDQDCFVGVGGYYGFPSSAAPSDRLWYYENTTVGATPISFERRDSINNPLVDIVLDPVLIGNGAGSLVWSLQFFDGDTDGGYDVLSQSATDIYWKNEGDSNTAMIQMATSPTPLDSLVNVNLSIRHINYVDVDGDLDFDVVVSNPAGSIRYFENITPVGVKQLNKPAKTIGIYPNPSKGNIILERAVTGQLNVFNLTGQRVYTEALELTRMVNLSSLEEGTYLLSIQEGDKHLQQTIVIQK